MAYQPYSPATSDVYWLYNPANGVTARFNGDITHPDWCGALTETPGGLASPDVRAASEELVEADGVVHGDFYFGARPITMNGLIYGHQTLTSRVARQDKIERATLALRADCELHILPSNGTQEIVTWLRRQERVTFEGGWNKTFQLALVSEHARLSSVAIAQPTVLPNTDLVVENQGSYPSVPVLRVTGPVNDGWEAINTTTGAKVKFKAGQGAIGAGGWVDIDMKTHTVVSNTGADWTDRIDFINSTWPTILSGNNIFRLNGSGTTGATQLRVSYRHTWA